MNPRYHVDHLTRYVYTAPVSQSWQLAHLSPRTLPGQKLLSHALHVDPEPDEQHDALDSFGNTVTHFALHGAHRMLSVRMQCVVEVADRAAIATPLHARLREVRQVLRDAPTLDELNAARLSQPTVLVPFSEAAYRYAEVALRPERDWFEAVSALMQAIHDDFEFDPNATTVSTPVDEVLRHRRGVCQDFAHLMLACLRSHGLPARYVSGYLLTDPPPGQPRLVGADATHAWVAAFLPHHGWVEFDPTNRQLADRRYITLAWGADFADVVPLRGVILGGGDQALEVEVGVTPQ
jgi:transglutaminase-like putative cysteine protease